MSIVSPCIRNCCLDKEDVCIGCGRTLDEIILWGEADDKQRLQVLLRSKKRMAQRKDKRI